MFTEIESGYRFTLGPGEVSGTRVFQEDDNGTLVNLPTRNVDLMVDPSGQVVEGCKAQTIVGTLRQGKANYTVQYKSGGGAGGGGGGQSIASSDPESRTYDMRADQILLSDTGSFEFDVGNQAAPMEQGFPFMDLHFTIPVSGMSFQQKTIFMEACGDRVGALNASQFEEFNEGNVRFEGLSGGDYWTSGQYFDVLTQRVKTYTVRLWAFTMSFSNREFNFNLGTNPTTYTWRHEWNPTDGAWDKKVLSTDTDKWVYKVVEFGSPQTRDGFWSFLAED